jgi:hypothetical protein
LTQLRDFVHHACGKPCDNTFVFGRSLKRYFEKRDEEFRELVEETREFNREILLRNEKVYTSAIAEMEEGRKQIQANTKAVLSVLDRLNGSSA